MEYDIETISCWELTSLLFLHNFTIASIGFATTVMIARASYSAEW